MTNNQTNSKTNNDPKMPCPICGRPNPVSLIYCENEDCIADVNGGEMLGHWGGVKLYHPVGKASEKVRANWPA